MPHPYLRWNPSGLDLARLAAIKQYAALEFDLAGLLQHVLSITFDESRVIFYGVSNTRSRYAMMADLIGIRHDPALRKSWGRIENWLGLCDTARNHFVHWQRNTTMFKSEQPPTEEQPFGIFEHKLSNPKKTDGHGLLYSEDDIYGFCKKFDVMCQIVTRFSSSFDPNGISTWQHIFLQPITDQSPEEFLLRLNDAGHPAPPISSRLLW